MAGSSRRRKFGTALGLAGGAGAVAAVVAALAQRRWIVDDDPCGPGGLQLPEGRTVRVAADDGADLEVLVAGPAAGPTVVLPHCWGGTRALWAAVARRLVEAGHQVVLYDHRGHGSSTMGSSPATVDQLGEDLKGVLEHLDLRDVVLAGHSMGGMTVQALAVNHPGVIDERVRAIVLAATSAKPLPRALAASLVDRALGDALLKPWAKNAIGLVLTRGAVGRKVHRAHVEATRDAFFGTAGAVRSGFLVGMSNMDYREGLASITVPTTVLVGTRDRLTPPRMARLLAELIPKAELIVLPDAGHMLPMEEPDAITQAILGHTSPAPESAAAQR
ncbi:MAG: alpha/beta fold hydrolase [Acidimicrobiales bacterium]|nr:alpha/beta fold hydrolase [Acidimicrobiales bacterium]